MPSAAHTSVKLNCQSATVNVNKVISKKQSSSNYQISCFHPSIDCNRIKKTRAQNMDVEKIFSDLESNQTHECEEAKKKLVELFAQNKEQWLVHYMMDYFFKTNSLRIQEVLVKVQSPHDNYILDRLAEWLKTQAYRVQALNLFCFVVRKHPTWLFKVEKHRLIKDILKLLLNEKDIVPLMSALLCIITLLPIIPNLVPNFLNDLFDVFGHLASWNSQSPNWLPDDKLVHLQLGLQMFFHRLYGMYPCNFLAYLSDFIKKEKGAIFHHTIKPLLETVRVHPMLVTATIETEVSNSRWKEKEPHDVVEECANLSLPAMHQDLNAEHTYHQLASSDFLDTPGGIRRPSPTSITWCSSAEGQQIFHSQPHIEQQTQRQLQLQHRYGGPITRFDTDINSEANIWSPYNEITTSGPIPLTPTPSLMLPLATSASINNRMIGGASGSSPPEAAIEATPETTPMKELKDLKHQHSTALTSAAAALTTTIANPNAVRAIFATSQPSSPMRKESNQFHFPEMSSSTMDTGLTATATTVVEQESRLVTRVTTTTTYDRRLQQVLQDRTRSQSPFQTIETLAAKQQQQQGGFRSPIIDGSSSKCDTPEIDYETLSSQAFNSTPTTITPIPTPTLLPVVHISKTCDNCTETERFMCSAGGLHIPTSQSMQILVRGIKRRSRNTSYCCNDTSCERVNSSKKDDTTSPSSTADVAKMRRTKSCSSITLNPLKMDASDGGGDGTDEDSDTATTRQQTKFTLLQHNERRLQKSGKMLAIATATKKAVVTSTMAATSYCNAASQTIAIQPHNYENSLLELLLENTDLRKAYNRDRNSLYPNEILEQFIARTIKSKENFNAGYGFDQEQYQLLCLQLQYERYRREIHAERNRRLMGRSRVHRSLEMERDRLREQVKNFAAKNKEHVQHIDKIMKTKNESEQMYMEQLIALEAKYQNELEQNKGLRQENENLQTRLNEELVSRKEVNYELESLRGQIFNMTTELQHAQVQVELGLQCKHELARLEAEFIVMGEVQIKCRDRLAELDNFKARDEELQMLQDNYNMELKELRHMMDEKASQLDSAKHKIVELQAQLVNNDKVITEQKRLLKSVKDEYEEKFKSLNNKYEVQKTIILQMEEKMMMSMHKPQAAIAFNACSPDTDKTDIASSMDRNSPLSTSLASSESLSASLRSTELRNLQQLVETPIPAELASGSNSMNVVGTGASIIEGTRLSPAATLDMASSANTAAAINIVPSSSTSLISSSSVAAAVHNFELTSHTHPHVHLQQQQKKPPQQQPHQQQKR